MRMARSPRCVNPLFCTKGVALASFTACINYRDSGHANKFEWLKVRTNDLFLCGPNLRTGVEFQQVYLRNKSMYAGTVEYKRMFCQEGFCRIRKPAHLSQCTVQFIGNLSVGNFTGRLRLSAWLLIFYKPCLCDFPYDNCSI